MIDRPPLEPEEPAAPLLAALPGAAGEVGRALIRAARLHRLLAGQRLRRIGLYPSQELIMMRLWDDGPQRQGDLARLLGIDGAAMTRTVQRLEQGGFVRRVPSPDDRRVTILEPTAASRVARAEVTRTWTELEQATVAALDDDRRAALVSALALVADALEQSIRTDREADAPLAPECEE